MDDRPTRYEVTALDVDDDRHTFETSSEEEARAMFQQFSEDLRCVTLTQKTVLDYKF